MAADTNIDEFGNKHVRTGIPMSGFECAHVECPEWHILTNGRGRAEVYGRGDGVPGVAVLFDSLDRKLPSAHAKAVLVRLVELRDAINEVLNAASKVDGPQEAK